MGPKTPILIVKAPISTPYSSTQHLSQNTSYTSHPIKGLSPKRPQKDTLTPSL